MTEQLLVHAIPRTAWAQAGDPLEPTSLAEEGFIHLSRVDQIADVANARFAGCDDLLLLVIAQADLPAPPVWEDSYGAGQEFPHLYAPLPHAAVSWVQRYAPDDDGRFSSPDLQP